MQLRTESDNDNARCRLWLDGELSIYHAAELKTALLQAIDDCRELELNLAGVTELDTAGAQLLILAKREADARGKRLLLGEYSPVALEAIERLNLAACLDARQETMP